MAGKTTPKSTAKQTPAPTEAQDDQMLKKKELFDQVVMRTSLKKRDVKPAVEAALAVIAEHLRAGHDVNLPPLGKVRVIKTKQLENGATVGTLKLRTPKNASAAATSGLAPEGDAD